MGKADIERHKAAAEQEEKRGMNKYVIQAIEEKISDDKQK